MTKKCFRCGRCCNGYLAQIPKTKEVNLSPKFLEEMELLEALRYVEIHSELMDSPCKWLQKNADGKFKCLVYANRSSNCRNYPEGEGDCRVGKYLEELKERIKQ